MAMFLAQFHPELCECDAVSNEVAALDRLFCQQGWRSATFASRRYGRWVSVAHSVDQIVRRKPDLLIVHYSQYDDSFEVMQAARCPMALMYHGVTPSVFLRGSSRELHERSRRSAAQLKCLYPSLSRVWTHSEFSSLELQAAGIEGAETVPYLLLEELYQIPADERVVRWLTAMPQRHLLMIGRLLPHKRFELGLLTLRHLQRRCGDLWSLHIIGSCEGDRTYLVSLRDLAQHLNLCNVYFHGKVKQSVLNAYLKCAFALLVTSTHEAFCVPVIEAFQAGIPVLGFAAGALPETARGAGLLLQSTEPYLLAHCLEILDRNPGLRERMILDQRSTLGERTGAAAQRKWLSAINRSLKNGPS
jgi:glycosyltransferase involved in cell wall biosynthesis